MNRASQINAAEVNRGLTAPTPSPGTRFAGYVLHFPLVDSTSDLALQAAQSGAQHGVWVADEQTAGRGRGGHTWLSVPGDGLYVSALVRFDYPAHQAMLISLAAGLAAQTAIEANTGLRIDLRWPNDLMLHGRKCGGILVETAIEPSASEADARLRYAVIGIGINVNHAAFPPALATLATSLHIETGVPIVRQPLLIALLRELDREIGLLGDQYRGTDNGAGVRERFTAASTWVRGKRVQVPEQGGYTGTTAGLDSRGFLLVNCDDGKQRTVLSGGVREL